MCSHDNWKLVRTDKNGTKYYETYTCQRCGGRGYVYGYEHVEGGICFECGGSGKSKHRTWKEYTPEYAEKLEQKRAAKALAQAPERNNALFGKLGICPDGSAYVVMGNTYERKNQLKDAGAHYHPALGWYFDHQTEDFDVRRFSAEDFMVKDEFGRWNIYSEKSDAISKAQMEYECEKIHSEFVGKIGDKISIEVDVERVAGYETQWGYTSVFTMVDADGNFFVWKTSSGDMDKGSHVKVSGKIKEHSEYRGIKQTVLTRCKVTEV